MRLQWPEGSNTDSYTLQVLDPETGAELYAMTTRTERSCLLPELPADRPLTVRVSSAADYRNTQRPGEAVLERTFPLAAPRIETPQWTVDPDTDPCSPCVRSDA